MPFLDVRGRRYRILRRRGARKHDSTRPLSERALRLQNHYHNACSITAWRYMTSPLPVRARYRPAPRWVRATSFRLWNTLRSDALGLAHSPNE